MNKTIVALGAAALVACSGAANAALIKYSFTTAAIVGGALDGQSVSGTFTYDNTPGVSFIIPGGIIAGSQAYVGNVTDFSASMGGNNFSYTAASVIVGDDKFNPGGPGSPFDLIQIFPTTGFVGFSLFGYTLISANIYFVETVVGFDFLDDQSLPEELNEDSPDIPGVMGLLFRPIGAVDGSRDTQVFFGKFFVERVPEPAMLGLFGLGFLGLAATRRRKA